MSFGKGDIECNRKGMASSVQLQSAESTPVSREQAFLETYFQCLSHFAYDKAKDHVEKERETHKALFASSWGLLVNSLIHLATAERSYMSLMFLGQKWFGRKDTLRTNYGILIAELKKIEENSQQHVKESKSPVLEKILGHLCGQLVHFLTARTKTMDFYEQMTTMGSMKSMVYEDLIIVITDIIQTHQKNFHHPILSSVKSSFSFECDIIHHLLQAQVDMAESGFLLSLLHLNNAHTKLNSWSFFYQASKESKKTFYGTKHSTKPALFQWLMKYKGALVSKFTLYFHETLSKQLPSAYDMKSLTTKATVDYYGKIVSFQKKCAVTNISLVLDANGMEDRYKGPGYHHPEKYVEPIQGKNTYPIIFSYPNEILERMVPEIVMLITDRAGELNSHDKVVYLFDKDVQTTYFLCKAEPRMTLVVIFDTKKSEKESYVMNFMLDICSQLRCSKLFLALKAGSKG